MWWKTTCKIRVKSKRLLMQVKKKEMFFFHQSFIPLFIAEGLWISFLWTWWIIKVMVYCGFVLFLLRCFFFLIQISICVFVSPESCFCSTYQETLSRYANVLKQERVKKWLWVHGGDTERHIAWFVLTLENQGHHVYLWEHTCNVKAVLFFCSCTYVHYIHSDNIKLVKNSWQGCLFAVSILILLI